jgi:hypothetical protein
MSTCISRAGEYSEHQTDPGNFICDRCGALDEDGLFAELERTRSKRDEFAALLGRALPAVSALAAAEEVGDRWYGYGHGPYNIHPSESLPCSVCDLLREFRAVIETERTP